MCGITGFVGRGNLSNLNTMLRSIEHRGPDHKGTLERGAVHLGHARLSVIDLSPLGNQPMLDQQKTVAVISNGEIYNFRELRTQLEKTKKYKFRSNSDTEVILYSYLEYGEKCFDRFEGMFAMAIYDFENKKLILARDRMGKKPLYFALHGDTLVFGSEAKAVLAHPNISAELDLNAASKYFFYGYVPTPHSIFKGIHKLEPGSFLRFKNGTLKKISYWEPNQIPQHVSKDKAIHDLDVYINDSVKRRLIADVPLGVLLSGGLDSSTIAYYAARASTAQIKTFSISFEEKSFDESEYASLVSKHLGTKHETRLVTAEDLLKTLPHITSSLDEPFADPSIVPTYILSKFTREHVTVALSGDGADELFAGYPTFLAEKFAGWYEHVPGFIHRTLVNPLVQYLPARNTYFSLDFKLKKFLEGFSENKAYRHSVWLSVFGKTEQQLLLTRDAWHAQEDKNTLEDIDRYLRALAHLPEKERALRLYQRTYLMDDVLVKVDRASMLEALEIRSPFLDCSVVEYANSLPYQLKFHNFTTKYILKQLMKDRLPKSIVYRSKKGFAMPIARWLNHELKDFCHEVLSEGNIKQHGMFQSTYVDRLFKEHESGKQNHARKLWTLLMFNLWYKIWIG